MLITCEQKSRDVSQVFLSNTNSAFDMVTYANMSYEKVFTFTAAVRGYHYYRRFWFSKPSQQLYCVFEPDNLNLNQQEGEEYEEQRQRTKKKLLKRKEVPTKSIRNFSETLFSVSTVSSNKKNNTNKAIIETD